ncbi:hypothetical protein COY27_06300 [Candidatus Woesearchaeota archaeon CG_4_10_14_0_2_um_filter_33_13]|nr:MAG: hypothetical protein COY27_06300 [Candidatus Woesearchaeota archaeon CG_4_10_14_0_2_um_filter_33_13]
MLYTEGIVWYLFFLDSLVYVFMTFSKGKLHQKLTHWLSGYFPLNRFFSLFYLILVMWLGFALYRMQLLGFYFN